MYRKTGRDAFVSRMAQHGISAKALATGASNWVVMTRRSLMRDYIKSGVVPDASDAWCWSMWSGYLNGEDGGLVRTWFEDGGSRAAHIHMSGHASPSDLRTFANVLNAKQVVPIHGVAWDGQAEGFSSITRLADGQALIL